MIAEVGLFAETALAYVTLERPTATVHICVRLQVAWRRERLVTQRTLVRLLLWILHHKHVLAPPHLADVSDTQLSFNTLQVVEVLRNNYLIAIMFYHH